MRIESSTYRPPAISLDRIATTQHGELAKRQGGDVPVAPVGQASAGVAPLWTCSVRYANKIYTALPIGSERGHWSRVHRLLARGMYDRQASYRDG